MSGGIAFTSNYTDLSHDDGYQFEFRCERCGNGFQSNFRHSIVGFGSKLMTLGGGLIGGNVGNRMQQFGWNAERFRNWRGSGTTRDRQLAEAVEDVRPNFEQCHRCGKWVCRTICWNDGRGLCADCAPKLDQEVAGMQAQAQREQLYDRIRQQDWTAGVPVTDGQVAICPTCRSETGGGNFCQHCGTALTAGKRRFCGNCGTQLNGSGVFCGGCGSSVL